MKPPAISREFAQSEYDHAVQQRDEAQARINQIAQALQQAQAAFLVAEGATQQAKAFLEKFPADDEESK